MTGFLGTSLEPSIALASAAFVGLAVVVYVGYRQSARVTIADSFFLLAALITFMGLLAPHVVLHLVRLFHRPVPPGRPGDKSRALRNKFFRAGRQNWHRTSNPATDPGLRLGVGFVSHRRSRVMDLANLREQCGPLRVTVRVDGRHHQAHPARRVRGVQRGLTRDLLQPNDLQFTELPRRRRSLRHVHGLGIRRKATSRSVLSRMEALL